MASINVASQANGGVASASSQFNGSYVASNANSGSRDNAKGSGWGGAAPSGGWNDGDLATFPDWWQVDFAASWIGEIDVITLHDVFASSHPSYTLADTFTLYGIVNFLVQYWDGSTWQTVTGGNVTGNNKIWTQYTFTAVYTTKVRITVSASAGANDYSRLVEVEVWSADAPSSKPYSFGKSVKVGNGMSVSGSNQT